MNPKIVSSRQIFFSENGIVASSSSGVYEWDNNEATQSFKQYQILSILVVWLECRFLDTEVDGSNPGISMLCH